ncbi:ferric reductase family protein [Aspergillus fumigatus Af293]|uniref:ferric-chelate reductase (NADPH) n=2 Tax=Aspergillus fumigatus TaxID=746128 RepID=Q4WWA1_ASPFU|nr:cell surface metalloreductase (FreA), putative [Aspergillus fumigatus Af293]EAL91125.1 cell surface metalloreductase (FreA), putative [Aspergillus fumigatus Af293]EDP49872.1 cell surface metalloreductase (FreA), putative [Aspergillus fumigatus A1163]
MDALAIYAIVAGGIFAGLFLARTLSTLAKWSTFFSILLTRHLTLPFIVHRHQLLGPWTRASVLLHVSYAAINAFLVVFRAASLTGAGRRAGELALVNLIFPLSAIHLSNVADLLGISWGTCRKVHRATGWMATALLAFHVVVAVQDHGFSFPLSEMQNLFTMIGAASLGAVALLSISWFRRWSYEVFLRSHQIFAILFVYGTWRHLPSAKRPPKLYLLIALALFGTTSFLELVTLLYRNGLFAGRGCPRAIVTFKVREAKEADPVVTATQVRIVLPRPLTVEAGQYINLWIPSVGLWSWTQTHPFTVTSWSRSTQDTLELLVQPRRGLSADLLRYAPVAAQSSISFLALFTGPHGTSEDVSHYESVLVIASGFGIAAAVPYLKKMIYGYNTCTSQVRRLHLVWQVESIGEVAAAQTLLNNLLKDDIVDEGYILNISIYVGNGLEQNKLPFGQHKRVCLYRSIPDYDSIISLEASGDQVERLPNIREERGRTLVMVSTADELRDQLRETVKAYLHRGVNLSELEYQPSAD